MVRIQSIWLYPFSSGTFPGRRSLAPCSVQRKKNQRCSTGVAWSGSRELALALIGVPQAAAAAHLDLHGLWLWRRHAGAAIAADDC